VHSPANIPTLLFTSIPDPSKSNLLFGFYYRGLTFSIISLLFTLGKGQLQLLHLVQFLLHSLNAVFLYLFYRYWVRQTLELNQRGNNNVSLNVFSTHYRHHTKLLHFPILLATLEIWTGQVA
jgi:hypothetical protein